MALRNDCSRMGWLLRLATAALISGSALLAAGGPAAAHHYRHTRYFPRVAHAYPHATHYARYSPRWRVHSVRQTVAAVSASPAFSALVVDANSGKTLYAADENGLRHPASITKVMTLYLLFEKLDQRRDDASDRDPDLRARRCARALEARPSAGRYDQRRGRDQGRRDPFGE